MLDVLFGFVGRMRVKHTELGYSKHDVETKAHIELEFETGTGILDLDWNASVEKKEIILLTNDGELKINFLEKEGKQVGSHMQHEYDRLLADFVDSIDKERTFERELAVLKLVEEIYKNSNPDMG